VKGRGAENQNPFVPIFSNAESIFCGCVALPAFGVSLRGMPGHLRQQFIHVATIYSTAECPIFVEHLRTAWPFHCVLLPIKVPSFPELAKDLGCGVITNDAD
jgi:hypothetical protein